MSGARSFAFTLADDVVFISSFSLPHFIIHIEAQVNFEELIHRVVRDLGHGLLVHLSHVSFIDHQSLTNRVKLHLGVSC